MPLALEIGAGILMFLVIVLIADRDQGAAGKIAHVVIGVLVFAAIVVGLFYGAHALGIIGPIPDTHTGR